MHVCSQLCTHPNRCCCTADLVPLTICPVGNCAAVWRSGENARSLEDATLACIIKRIDVVKWLARHVLVVARLTLTLQGGISDVGR